MKTEADTDQYELDLEDEKTVKDPELKVEDDDEEAVDPELAKEPEDDIDSGINDLKAQLERERIARMEAEKRAREAAEAASKASGDVHDTNIQLLNTAIDTVKRENAMLKARYREAAATGDADTMAEVQETMSMNAAKLMQLEAGKTQLESRPRPTYEMPRSEDPVEAFASQLSPKSADFIRKNPQCVTDPRLNKIMISAHELALSKGMQADTDEYFGFIADTLDLPSNSRNQRKEQESSPMSEAAESSKRKSAPPAAPVSRSAPNNSGARPSVVRLTKDEREMAQMMGMTNEEYARNKIALVKEGRLNS